jgi:hypothetical protein
VATVDNLENKEYPSFRRISCSLLARRQQEVHHIGIGL